MEIKSLPISPKDSSVQADVNWIGIVVRDNGDVDVCTKYWTGDVNSIVDTGSYRLCREQVTPFFHELVCRGFSPSVIDGYVQVWRKRNG